jgi:hypothetical protein
MMDGRHFHFYIYPYLYLLIIKESHGNAKLAGYENKEVDKAKHHINYI